jgi:hypothetical protein
MRYYQSMIKVLDKGLVSIYTNWCWLTYYLGRKLHEKIAASFKFVSQILKIETQLHKVGSSRTPNSSCGWPKNSHHKYQPVGAH